MVRNETSGVGVVVDSPLGEHVWLAIEGPMRESRTYSIFMISLVAQQK